MAREHLVWPTLQEMMLGTEPIFVSGATPYVFATGHAAYGLVCRIDDTQVTSITDVDGTTTTNKTWQNVAMKAGIDCIIFDIPVASITLNAAGSIALYPIKYQS